MANKNGIDYSKIYSPYKLSLFEQCPQEYYYTYLDPVYKRKKYKLQKLPEHIWPFQTVGSAVHDAITLFYHQPPENRSREVLLDSLEKTWRNFDSFPYYDQTPLGWRGGFSRVEEERTAYKETQKLLKAFYKIRDPDWEIFYTPTKNFKNSIEDYQNLIQPLTTKYDISGKFDLIIKGHKGLQVIDFKTGRKDGNDGFQLRFYKLLAEKNFGRPVSKTSYFFLKEGTKKEEDVTDINKKTIEEEILEKIQKIKNATNFEPRPSKLCDYCLFHKDCRQNAK